MFGKMMGSVKGRTALVWRIPTFPILLLLNFMFGLATSLFIPFSSLFGIDEVGMSNLSYGIFMTTMAIGGVVISTYIGKLSDRNVSRKLILIVSSVAAIAGYMGFAYIRNYILLALVGFFLLGIASATMPQLWAHAREVLEQSDVPKKEIPYVMNVFRMFTALAWTVGPAFAGWVLVAMDFKGLFMLVSIGFLLCIFAIIFFLKDEPKKVDMTGKQVVLGKFMLKPHIFANILAMFLLHAATTINMQNIPQFVTKTLGGTEAHVGVIFSVPPVFEVPLMIMFGIMATRWDLGKLIKLGFLFSFAYFFLIWNVTEPWQIYPLQVLSAANVAITAGLAVTYFQNFLPKEPGTATTLYMNAQKIGSTLGFLLFGYFSSLFEYQNVFIICILFTGIGFFILLFFGSERKQSKKLHVAES
ncbi:sugar efflux transporter [Radiobacillus kanasensis]|uniref:sugar efflux transporter n=1 Tax=Radiobacillus kanasensis TaxID=2844358 RepID=UPI001E532C27|nr:sugar efflux transporter [Radiobacillus kanasensis]UFU00770.1 sugar efflux transporter [Radiobacillus kanasensis]